MGNENDSVIQDISVEGLSIGYLYKLPDTLIEYEELIVPEYDFSDEGMRFLYEVLHTVYHANSQKVDEIAINIQISKMDDNKQKMFNDLGGNNVIKRLIKIAEGQDNFQYLYERLKVFNLLRELDKKGFSVRNNLDKLKNLSPDKILKAYEMQLTKIGTYIKGLNESVEIGKGMTDFYEKLKSEPDIGIEIPHPIINSFARGWRKNKVYASGMHSGLGKSREMAYYATYMSIVNQIPLLIIVNEQDETEWRGMILTCVINNIFAPKTGIYVDEEDIMLGKCTGEKDRVCKIASNYIEQRSKIRFQEINSYDFDTLKVIFKKHKLKGIDYVIFDTFKPFRAGNVGMADYALFVYTSERFKQLVGSFKKGGLEMGLWLTFQLTDESLVTKILNSTSIASGKQIKHNLDFVKMSRQLDYKDKQKIKYKLEQPDNPFNGEIRPLETYKDYYLCFLDKNRGGKDKKYIIYEVDRGRVIFKELGWAVFNSKEDEEEFLSKE